MSLAILRSLICCSLLATWCHQKLTTCHAAEWQIQNRIDQQEENLSFSKVTVTDGNQIAYLYLAWFSPSLFEFKVISNRYQQFNR